MFAAVGLGYSLALCMAASGLLFHPDLSGLPQLVSKASTRKTQPSVYLATPTWKKSAGNLAGDGGGPLLSSSNSRGCAQCATQRREVLVAGSAGYQRRRDTAVTPWDKVEAREYKVVCFSCGLCVKVRAWNGWCEGVFSWAEVSTVLGLLGAGRPQAAAQDTGQLSGPTHPVHARFVRVPGRVLHLPQRWVIAQQVPGEGGTVGQQTESRCGQCEGYGNRRMTCCGQPCSQGRTMRRPTVSSTRSRVNCTPKTKRPTYSMYSRSRVKSAPAMISPMTTMRMARLSTAAHASPMGAAHLYEVEGFEDAVPGTVF